MELSVLSGNVPVAGICCPSSASTERSTDSRDKELWRCRRSNYLSKMVHVSQFRQRTFHYCDALFTCGFVDVQPLLFGWCDHLLRDRVQTQSNGNKDKSCRASHHPRRECYLV